MKTITERDCYKICSTISIKYISNSCAFRAERILFELLGTNFEEMAVLNYLSYLERTL